MDAKYLVNGRPNYGDVIGRIEGKEVIFTDDFEIFIDQLLRTLSGNFQVIAEILTALGADPDDVDLIIKNGVDPMARQFAFVRSDTTPPIPDSVDSTSDVLIAARQTDGKIRLYEYNPD